MKSLEIKGSYMFVEDIIMMRMYNSTETEMLGKVYTSRGVSVHLRTRDYPYNISLGLEEYNTVKLWVEKYFSGRLILC